jgi:hypothetical protein
MLLSRFTAGLILAGAMLTTAALAVPPIGIGVGAGASGNVHVGTPQIGVPSVNHPPVNAPPVNLPQARPSSLPAANANASAHANAKSAVVAGLPLHGTVTAVGASTVSVKLANGTVQTYTVSSATAAALQSSLHKSIAFTTQNGVLTLSNRTANSPLRGTLTALSGSTATVRLVNGKTQTFTVTSDESTWLKTHVGKRIAFWTDSNGTLKLNKSRQH